MVGGSAMSFAAMILILSVVATIVGSKVGYWNRRHRELRHHREYRERRNGE